jgi:hypothetical protein
MQASSFSKKFISCFMAGIMSIALLLVLGNSGTLSWFPPEILFSLVGLCFLSSVIFPFVWHQKEKNKAVNSEKIYAYVYCVIRYTIAFNLASFGWKKLFSLQFVVPLEIASKPMNEQSGEWLTWYYFGYSFGFGIILSVIQIGGAYLLLFRRTLLLGSCILLAFILNLALINIFYGMNAGALLQSILLTIGILYLLHLEYNKLKEFFLNSKSSFPPINISLLKKHAIRISAIILSLLFTIYLKSLM